MSMFCRGGRQLSLTVTVPFNSDERASAALKSPPRHQDQPPIATAPTVAPSCSHQHPCKTESQRRTTAPDGLPPKPNHRPPCPHHCLCATHRRHAPASASNDALLPMPHGNSTTPHPTREHNASRPHHPTTSIKPPSPSRQLRLLQTPSRSKTARIAAATRPAQ